MVKILFLDVDGVINVPRGMDRQLLTNLKSIVEDTKCKIVVSSDWRCNAVTRNELKRILQMFGLDFIGCTPQSQASGLRRPEEILDWIKAHNLAVEQGRGPHQLGEVEEWVAIDDRPLLSEVGGSPALKGHFVQTKSGVGLTIDKAHMAKSILRGEAPSGTQPLRASVESFFGCCEPVRAPHLRSCKLEVAEQAPSTKRSDKTLQRLHRQLSLSRSGSRRSMHFGQQLLK